MPTIIEDRLHLPQVTTGIQPRVHVFGLEVEDGAVVPGCGDFRLRLVGDGGE
jgi:hypothetical protein